MKKIWKIWFKLAVLLCFLFITWKGSWATIDLTDCFSVDGFVRYEFGYHTGEKNPALAERNNLTISRFWLNTEWNYKPSETFKIFANIRLMGDTTSLWDNDLPNYNAFPVDVPKYDWMMMKASKDHFRAEVWELYSDLSLGDLWLRLGRQQIAWGEMIGSRILDQINALDFSWNMFFEPEEFALVRIPEWTIRGIYQIRQTPLNWLTDTTIEAFVIPVDWYPQFTGDKNAPFQLLPSNIFFDPSFTKLNQKDRRGDAQYGVRLGGMLAGKFYLTLNYMSLYAQSPILKFRQYFPYGFLGPVLDFDVVYPHINIFGLSVNYAFGNPYNLVVAYEATWIPDQPYQAATPRNGVADEKDQGTFKCALSFSRPTKLVPDRVLGSSWANLIFQVTQIVVEGNHNKIAVVSKLRSKSDTNLIFSISQPLLHNDLTPGCQVVFDPRGSTSYYVKPSVLYKYGDHWYFDVFATFLGGDKTFNDGSGLGSLYWADTVYGRITYQF